MRKRIFSVLMMFVCSVMAPRAEGFIVESPKEGSTLVIGESFQWKIRLEPGEVCETINEGHPPFNASTGLYEWTDVIEPGDNTLGKESFFITGDPAETCSAAEITLKVVLPPTTVLKEISADISNGQEEGYLTLYKHANGNLVRTNRGFDEVMVGGGYSDGVWRIITGHPDTTYTSSDEKVVKVTPPGKWIVNDKYPELPRDEPHRRKSGDSALVTAVGPGTAKIIVRNGPHEDSVTAIVDVEPCSEWKPMKGTLPLCD